MATVSVSSVSKSYGTLSVLGDVSLEIGDGEFVSLVGPSGCGKSTLLRMIAGLSDIEGGEIAIDGRVVNGVAAKDRDIAMVFQNYALYPHMSVAENMGFALETQGKSKQEIAERVERAASILGLGALLDRLPRELSGGQQQRVAMGRAIVRKPKVFLFDEPLSNLDAQLRVQMRAEIKELHAELGVTIIYVTHDQIEAMTMSDRIVVLRGGGVEQAGAPLDLYDRPKTDFVGRFIGSPMMNMIAGKIDRSKGGSLVLPDGTVGSFQLQVPDGFHGSEIRVGIRPEDLAPADGGIPGRVVVIEPTGPETQIVVETAWGERLLALTRGRAGFNRGDTIHLRPDPARLHLFDTQNGTRLN